MRKVAPLAPELVRVVDEHLNMPEVRRRRKRNVVWAVSMVKNEADVIEASVRHLFSQGVDAMVVADNGSTDGTLDILRSLAREFPLYVAIDSLVAYEQSAKMTRLARFATEHGARWVVPFDADEFWFSVDDRSLADTLRNADPGVGVLEARMYNVFPTEELDPSRSLGEYRYRLCLQWTKLGKVAFRSHPDAVLAMGNHDVQCPGEKRTALMIMHLPWRSQAQMERKVRQGVTALKQADLPENAGRHWKAVAGSGPEHTLDHWQRVIDGVPDAANGLPEGAEVVSANPFLSEDAELKALLRR